MRKEQVIGIGMGGLQTISGWKQIVGNAHKQVGDIVWVDGNFAMVGQQRYSSRRPAPIPKESSIILIASTDGQYSLISKDDFSLISSGTFKHWPTDFISNLGYTTNRVAYNGNYAVVLVSATSYDSNGNQTATFTCFDLTTGNQLFSTTGYDIINSCGFYLEVSDSGSVSFGGIIETYVNSDTGSESEFISQVCTDGIMTTKTLSASDFSDDVSNLEDSIEYLLENRTVDMSRRTAYVRNPYGGIAEPLAGGINMSGIESCALQTPANLTINVSIPDINLAPVSNNLVEISFGNAKTGQYVGDIQYSAAQEINITGHLTASEFQWSGTGVDLNNNPVSWTETSYNLPQFLSYDSTDSYGNPAGHSIWPELYLPNGSFRDGLWDFPNSIGLLDADPDYDLAAANTILAQNQIIAVDVLPETGYDGQLILKGTTTANSSMLTWYVWKNGTWNYNGNGPYWGTRANIESYALTPMLNAGSPVLPATAAPNITNVIDYDGSVFTRNNYYRPTGQSMDIAYSTMEGIYTDFVFVGDINNADISRQIIKNSGINARETYFPVSVVADGSAEASLNPEIWHTQTSSSVTWGEISYGAEIGYGSGNIFLRKSTGVNNQKVATAYSTSNHEVALSFLSNGTLELLIDDVIVPNSSIYSFSTYAATEYNNSSGNSVFLLVSSSDEFIVKIGSGNVEKVAPTTSFSIGSTQIDLVSSLLKKI